MEGSSNFSKLELMQGRVSFIPNGWDYIHLNKVLNIRNNLRLPISGEERATKQGEYPYYGPTKIQDYINSYEQDGEYALIGEDGDHFLKFSKQSMTQLVGGKCTINNHAHIIKGTEKATREWFYYYFMHRDIFSFLSRQGAGRYKLNKAALEKLPMLVPPVSEQNKIAKILTTWDKAITTTEKLLANSQQQKKALMQQLLTGKKRFKEFDGSWEQVRFKDALKVVGGNAFKSELFKKSGVPIIRISNIKTDFSINLKGCIYYDEDKSLLKYKVEKGDVLIAMSGATTGKVGEYTGENYCYLNQRVGRFDVNKDILDASYLFQLLKLPYIQNEIVIDAVGGAQPNIGNKDIERIKISLPSLDEQKRISSVLFSSDNDIDGFKKRIECLKREKKALMQQLLTGKRRVKVDSK